MSINIWCRYPYGLVEKIDSASSAKEADYLAGEYQVAFGKTCSIWAGTKDGRHHTEKTPRNSVRSMRPDSGMP